MVFIIKVYKRNAVIRFIVRDCYNIVYLSYFAVQRQVDGEFGNLA